MFFTWLMYWAEKIKISSLFNSWLRSWRGFVRCRSRSVIRSGLKTLDQELFFILDHECQRVGCSNVVEYRHPNIRFSCKQARLKCSHNPLKRHLIGVRIGGKYRSGIKEVDEKLSIERRQFCDKLAHSRNSHLGRECVTIITFIVLVDGPSIEVKLS